MTMRRWRIAVLALMFGTMGCDRLGLGAGSGDEDAKSEDAKSEDVTGASDDDGSERAKAPENFEDKIFEVGETAELSSLAITLLEVKECSHDKERANEALAESGHKLVGALVEFEATGEASVPSRPNFRAHDEDDIVFTRKGLGGTDCSPKLGSKSLRTGEKARGWIGFKVPKDVAGLTMRYEFQPPKPKGAKSRPDKQYPRFSLDT